MKRLNIYIIYAFTIYPVVSYLTFIILNVAGHNFMGAFVYSASAIMIFTRKDQISIPKYLRFFLLFLLITVFADIFNGKTGNMLEYLYSNFYLKSFFTLFLIENTFFLERHIKKIKYGLFFILALTVIVFFVQILIDPTFLVAPSYLELFDNFDFSYRPLSIFSWNGPTAFGFSIPAIVSILVSENYLSGLKNRNYILFTIAIFLSFLSKSRWVMLSVIVIFLQVFKYEKGKIIKYTMVTLISVILTFGLVSYLGIDYNRIIQERIFEEDRGGLMEGSAGTRILAFKLFVEFYPENPIFGTGGVQTQELIKARSGRTSQIHVGFLSLFYYYGAVGGIFYLLFLYYLFKRMHFVAQNTGYWGSFFTMLAFVAANMTLVSLDVFKMGVILALVFHKYYENQLLDKSKDTKINMNTAPA